MAFSISLSFFFFPGVNAAGASKVVDALSSDASPLWLSSPLLLQLFTSSSAKTDGLRYTDRIKLNRELADTKYTALFQKTFPYLTSSWDFLMWPF